MKGGIAKSPPSLPRAKYCLDTGLFVDLYRGRYRRNVFTTLWRRFEGLISGTNDAIAPYDVFLELQKHDDELFKWAKKYEKKLFILPDQTVQQKITANFSAVPSWAPKKMALWADPVVVAMAACTQSKVVTSESILTPGERIPHICRKLGQPCLEPVDFFDELGWKI